MKAIILAAGKSTRTYPLTVTRPKVLLKVANKTLIEHNLEQLKGIVDEVVIVVGFMKGMIQEHLGDEYFGMRITYVEQKEQLGTGHALLQAKDAVKGSFLMLSGDDMYAAKDLSELAKKKNAALVKKVKDWQRFGVFEANGTKAVRVVEKPTEFVSDLANAGCYHFDEQVFGMLENLGKSSRGEIELTDSINELCQEGFELVEVREYWFPIGYPWNLLDANSHFLKQIKTDIQGEVQENVAITGEVVIGKGTVIRPGTSIEGPVIIGEDCIIGPGAYIRPETAIGNRCKVRAEVFDAIIGDESVMKHYSYVAHSVLGEDVNIGAGTITADYRHDGKNHITLVKDKKVDTLRRKLGAFMGDHVRTGINTSIYPGRKIWPYTGTKPGEVVQKDKMDMCLKPK